ncbi:MAG: inositol monophosphatase family protein [Methylococcales bacterium]|nr:inositol monophosphatase family protein [Methylococcales bacterium]
MSDSINAQHIEVVIREAGQLALTAFNDLAHVEVKTKKARDYVTETDVAVEKLLKQRLTALAPDLGFWGEESGQSADQTRRWIVDPIDGTHSFAKGQYFWGISVALEMNGALTFGAVYAPALDDYYQAELGQGATKNGRPIRVSDEDDLDNSMIATGFACIRDYLENNNLARFSRIAAKTSGQRRFGSAALDLCLVADGQVDAWWEQALNLYDVAAGALIAQEAGGTVTDFAGHPGVFPDNILATNGRLLAALLPLM